MLRRSLVVAAALAALCSVSTVRSESAAAAVGALAPAFTLEDHSGQKVSLADFAGKIVVLEWVNPECPFVQRHYKAKTMSRLAEKYKDQIVWLAVNTTSHADKSANAAWVSAHTLPYAILDDHGGQVGKLYGAQTTPHMYVIDAKGTLVYKGGIDDDPRGSKDEAARKNYVAQAIEELLAGKPVSMPESKAYGCSVKYAS